MSEKDKNIEVYTDEQAKKIEEHIEQYFGEIQNYFSEKKYDDIKFTINVIPPSRKSPYYTLVTSGMGGHIMNVPESLKEKKLERAELILCLPPNWDFEKETQEYFWPLHLLSLIARLPIKEDAWLGWGHTIDYGTNFADNISFSGIMLIRSTFGKESEVCELSDDEVVNFYQVLPIYETELEFKNKNGAAALLAHFPDNKNSLRVIDPDRRCCVPENFRDILDTVGEHSRKVTEKNLDVLEINGANHIAAFLRWMWENNMVNDEFLEYFEEDIEHIKAGEYDLRKFIINYLGGELNTEFFTDAGKKFCEYYYDHYRDEDEPCYPRDVDRMAFDYFGEEKYNSDEFNDEAYLFVPYDEEYYKNISKYIKLNFVEFLTKDIIDIYERHALKIEEKGLKIAKKNAVNHIAAFLLWSIGHELMNDAFMEIYDKYREKIESGELDIRKFVMKELQGTLMTTMFTQKGADFLHFYYSFTCEPPSYPDDVDKMALEYFGEKKYHSKKFKDEAYLFVPFDENYCKEINKYIDHAYEDFCYFLEHGEIPEQK